MNCHQQCEGFTLIEVLVGLLIMGVVALLAWRGIDILLRSHTTVLERSVQSKNENDVVSQWVRDCETMLSSETMEASQPKLSSFVQGNQQTWWIRSQHGGNRWTWQIVGYRLANGEFQRFASEPINNIYEALALWAGIYRDPDLMPARVQQTLSLSGVSGWQWSVTANQLAGSLATGGAAVPSPPRALRIALRLSSPGQFITRACLAGVLQ